MKHWCSGKHLLIHTKKTVKEKVYLKTYKITLRRRLTTIDAAFQLRSLTVFGWQKVNDRKPVKQYPHSSGA